MQNEFANRQAMHLTVLDFLDQPTSKTIWDGKPPVAFTQKVAAFRAKVADLTTLIASQQAAITGLTADKDREEEELEDLAFEIGQALAAYFVDKGREADAEKIDLPRSAWRRLRDTALLAKAALLQGLLDAALAADTAGLAPYGITPADSTALAKELADYAALAAAPAGGISTRRALTQALRPSFREANEILAALDRLVPRFRRAAGGPAFIANWRTARIIRDLGSGPAPDPANPQKP
jgi:hypothetical protein